MPTNLTTNSKIGDIQVPVSVSGMDVTTTAQHFTIAGVNYGMGEDWTHTVDVDPDEDRAFVGYLARRISDDVTVVVVDEVSQSDPELYDWAGSGYEPLFALWTLQVPAGATSLDAANLSITHHQPPPEE